LRAEIASEGARNPDVADMLRRSEVQLFALLNGNIRAAQQDGRISRNVDPIAVGERLALAFEGIMRLYVFSPDDGETLLARYYAQLAETLHLNA